MCRPRNSYLHVASVSAICQESADKIFLGFGIDQTSVLFGMCSWRYMTGLGLGEPRRDSHIGNPKQARGVPKSQTEAKRGVLAHSGNHRCKEVTDTGLAADRLRANHRGLPLGISASLIVLGAAGSMGVLNESPNYAARDVRSPYRSDPMGPPATGAGRGGPGSPPSTCSPSWRR